MRTTWRRNGNIPFCSSLLQGSGTIPKRCEGKSGGVLFAGKSAGLFLVGFGMACMVLEVVQSAGFFLLAVVEGDKSQGLLQKEATKKKK